MNNREDMIATFDNLITMLSIPIAAARCMLAFDEDDRAMVQETKIVYDELLHDVEECIPGDNA
jgi:hypothetical protein